TRHPRAHPVTFPAQQSSRHTPGAFFHQCICCTALSRSTSVRSAPLASLWTVLRILRRSWVASPITAAPTARPTAAVAIVETFIVHASFVSWVQDQCAPPPPNYTENFPKTTGKSFLSPRYAFFCPFVCGRIVTN